MSMSTRRKKNVKAFDIVHYSRLLFFFLFFSVVVKAASLHVSVLKGFNVSCHLTLSVFADVGSRNRTTTTTTGERRKRDCPCRCNSFWFIRLGSSVIFFFPPLFITCRCLSSWWHTTPSIQRSLIRAAFTLHYLNTQGTQLQRTDAGQ